MLQLTPQMRILVAVEPVDFRNGIDGLVRLCKEALGRDPFQGSVFAFRNGRGTAVKVLMYDGQGFWLCHKKLEPEDTQIFDCTEVGGRPIIGATALLKLAEWWESRINPAQGGASCPDKEVHASPPALRPEGAVPLDATLGRASTGAAAADAANSGRAS